MAIHTTWRRPMAVVLFLLVCVSGCSRYIRYEVSGTVKDASTGKPIPAIEVSVVGLDGVGPTTTDARGQFELRLGSCDRAIYRRPTWLLIFRGDGYDSEQIDVSPDPKKMDHTRIIVLVCLRPVQEKAASG